MTFNDEWFYGNATPEIGLINRSNEKNLYKADDRREIENDDVIVPVSL